MNLASPLAEILRKIGKFRSFMSARWAVAS